MGLQIGNTLTDHVTTPISYGFELSLVYIGTLTPTSRYKAGAHISVGGVLIGDVEIDMSEDYVYYYIPVGDVIKRYINKLEPTEHTYKFVNDSGADVEFETYIIEKVGDAWETPVAGETGTVYMTRGIHRDYYLKGDSTPQLPAQSVLFDSVSGVTNLPVGSLGFLYKNMDSDASIYTTLDCELLYYNHVGTAILSSTELFNNKTVDTNVARIRLDALSTPEDYSKVILTMTSREYNRSTDALISTEPTATYTINFDCVPTRDFSFDLIYLNAAYNWATIPFYTKNISSLNRTVKTIEGYDYGKTDINLKIRRTLSLKSDYMNKTDADEAMLLGITPELMVRFSGETNNKQVRLIDKSINMVSHSNDAMAQIEINVEFSEKILTP